MLGRARDFVDSSCPCSLRWPPPARRRPRPPRPTTRRRRWPRRWRPPPSRALRRPAWHGRRRPAEDHVLVRDRSDDGLRRQHPVGHDRQERPRRGAEQRVGARQGHDLPRAPRRAQRRRPLARRRHRPSRPAGRSRLAGRAVAAARGRRRDGPGPRPRRRPDAELRRPSSRPAAPPELGQSVGVAAQAGSVLVRLPGSTRAVALTDAASVPVGSIVDARKGTVTLSSALPGDDSQTGTFHGGLFEVRQPAGAHGMTELVLRGPLPTCAGGGARAAAASAKQSRRAPSGAATTTGASARAAATASPPSAAPRGTSRTAATAR